jgi:TfoX/Sxy family transcriptional regulator of competence genes
MAYDITLADRIRERFAEFENVEEKQMMGGLTFMLNDKMCVGVIKDEMMCRINPAIHETLIEMRGCRTMDFSHRPMIGYVLIEPIGMKTKRDFDYWIDLALEFNKTAKSSKRRKK